MRRIAAAPCPPKISATLMHRQTALDADPSKVQSSWKSFTRLKTYEVLRATLAEPLGSRRRCAFCSDSRAADVEHFWPKSAYPARTYVYENLLLVCPECNRAKLHRFPVDQSGLPLLVNPAADDPWDVLYFAPITGIIDARITHIGDSGEVIRDARGLATLDVLGPILNSTPVIEGRMKSWKALVSRLDRVLSGLEPLPESQTALFGDDDSFGLGEFMLNREGKESPQVRTMREREPQRWQHLRDLPRG